MIVLGPRIEGTAAPMVPGWAIFTKATVSIGTYLIHVVMEKRMLTEHAMPVDHVELLRGFRKQCTNWSVYMQRLILPHNPSGGVKRSSAR